MAWQPREYTNTPRKNRVCTPEFLKGHWFCEKQYILDVVLFRLCVPCVCLSLIISNELSLRLRCKQKKYTYKKVRINFHWKLATLSHSLLRQFTNLTFGRNANNKTMLPGFLFWLFQSNNGIFWECYKKFDWIVFKIWSLVLFILERSVSQSGSSWATEKKDR